MADYRPLVIGTGVTQRMTTGDRIEAGAGVVASSSVPLVLSAGGQGVQVASGDDLQPAANIAFTKEAAHTIKVTASTTTNAAGGNLTVAAGDAQGTGTAGNLYLRGGSGSTNGIVYLGDSNTSGVTASVDLTLAAGKSLVGAAGSGGLSLRSMTGDTTLPTGAVTWSGASGKNMSLTASGSGTASIGGSTSGSTALTLQAGSGNILLDAGANTIQMGSATAGGGTISIGNIAQVNGQTVNICPGGCYTSTNTINIGSKAGGGYTEVHTSTDKLFLSATYVGFYSTTPQLQQNSTGEFNGFTGGGGTTVTHKSTFTGNNGTKAYTISDVVKALKNYGLLASS